MVLPLSKVLDRDGDARQWFGRHRIGATLGLFILIRAILGLVLYLSH